MAKADLTAERLRELLHYSPETGSFTWAADIGCGHRREQIKKRAGDPAGYINRYGYHMIGIQGDEYRASRLAWLYCHGEHPPTKLTHLDGDPANHRIANLSLQGLRQKPTAERVRQLLGYDENSGVFTWKICPSSKALEGEAAGAADLAGYWVLCIDGTRQHAHRIAWLYVHGEWPKRVIDHINGDRADNRIENLRDVPHAHNIQNVKRAAKSNKNSSLLGAHWFPRRGKWKSSIRANGKTYHLGYFNSDEEAHRAYVTAKRKLHEGCTI